MVDTCRCTLHSYYAKVTTIIDSGVGYAILQIHQIHVLRIAS